MIIERLDDKDIQVRGEAFSSLVSNENDIAEQLVKNLNSEKTYVRGFLALILANRKNSHGNSEIIKMTKDKNAMVRSCALGALGHLKAGEAVNAVQSCFSDADLEVRKSAIKAAIDLDCALNPAEFKNFSNDEELKRLLVLAKQTHSVE